MKWLRNLLLLGSLTLAASALLAPGTAGADVAADSSVRRSIQAQSTHVHACLDRSFRRSPTTFGRLVVSFYIGLDGKVHAARIVRSPTPDRKVAACVVKAISLWTFQRPQSGRPLPVTYEFMFDLQDARG